MKNNNILDTEYAIEINNLSKSFNDLKVLDKLSLKVKKGQLYGFLGLNGAGKTTALNIILGLIPRDEGQILINNLDVDKNIESIRNNIGIVFQNSTLDPILSVYDNLLFRASLYKDIYNKHNIKKVVDDIIVEFQLEDIKNKRYKNLSGGQKRRVDIARSLIHKPSILFLDEPTTSLDPSSRKLVWQILNKIQRERNLTILLTTHYMEEANKCEFISILQKGKKIVEGTPTQLKSWFANTTVKVYSKQNLELEQIAKSLDAEINYLDKGYIFSFSNNSQAVKFVELISKITNDFELHKGTMEEVFINVTSMDPEQINEVIKNV
ncbi:ABC transporter ATP-binding protein [Mycoplasma corogypsi]|uniref:ABC transporter ATP-binding protein n=1 Tax=Mycoplasma corogypsi TaxID=2106 RepID=UPI003872E131